MSWANPNIAFGHLVAYEAYGQSDHLNTGHNGIGNLGRMVHVMRITLVVSMMDLELGTEYGGEFGGAVSAAWLSNSKLQNGILQTF